LIKFLMYWFKLDVIILYNGTVVFIKAISFFSKFTCSNIVGGIEIFEFDSTFEIGFKLGNREFLCNFIASHSLISSREKIWWLLVLGRFIISKPTFLLLFLFIDYFHMFQLFKIFLKKQFPLEKTIIKEVKLFSILKCNSFL